MSELNKAPVTRRSFLKKSALAGSVAAGGTLAAPAVLAQAPITMKMQTSWPASDIWMDFAKQYRKTAGFVRGWLGTGVMLAAMGSAARAG